MHATMSILRSRCYAAALLMFFFISFVTATAPRAQGPCMDDMIWAVFPTSKELGGVNDQLLTKSGPAVNQDGTRTFSMIWQGAAASRSVSVTITEYPDPPSAGKKVHEYGFDDKKGQIKTGMIKLGIGEEGYKTDDIQRPYYLVHKGQFALSYYTSYPGRSGGIPGDQDPTVAKIIQKIAALPCLGATVAPPPSKTSSNVASSPQDPKATNPTTVKGTKADAAGTTGTDKKPASNAAAASGVTNAPQPTGGACDWSGTWNTNRGKMELVQKGNARAGADVSGTASIMVVTSQNQTGTITFQDVSIVAIVVDDKLAGTWSQPPSYGPPKDAGDIEFTISPDCSSFTGNWRYGYKQSGPQTPWDGDWTGTRSGAGKPPSTPVTKQTACASAKPSITDGSVFKRAEFTIGGTEPQKVTITSSADNFAIKKEYGGIVYQRIDGKSWGSLTLEPGNYILSCSGGGAMGLMSATVCIEYPVVQEVPPAGNQTVPPEPKKKKKPPTEEVKPSLPIGPVERIIICPRDKQSATALFMKIGETAPFMVAWGEDANGHKISVTVEEWKVSNKKIGSIDKDGLFKADADGDVKIMATVKNSEGETITGSYPITVSARDPIIFTGVVRFEDENGKEMTWPAAGYLVRCTYGTPPDLVLTTRTDAKGAFEFKVPFREPRTGADIRLARNIPAPAGYVWEPVDEFINRPYGGYMNSSHFDLDPAGGKQLGFVMNVKLKKQPEGYIWGNAIHNLKGVGYPEVKLLDQSGSVVETVTGTKNGGYEIALPPNLSSGQYRLTVKSKGRYTTLHNWLVNKQDVWVDLPISVPKRIDIELVSWAEKVGYTGP